MSSEIAAKILNVFDTLSGGVHAGFRPVHARGIMVAGTFAPTAAAAGLDASSARRPVGRLP